MEDHEREQPPTKPPLNEDELELSLGLRPRPAAAVEKAKVDAPEGSGDLSLRVPVWRKLASEFDCEFSGLELEAKREAQTMRRREARRKREEKRKLKAGGEDKKRRRKASFLVSGVPCYNYMMMPGLVGSDAGGLRVAGGAGFRPYVVADGVKLSGSGCSRASSPGGSDHRSTSQGGSSSEGGSHSSHSHILDQTTANGPTTSNGKGEASSSSQQQIEPTQTLKTTPNTESCNITTNSEVQTEASPSKKPSPTHTSEANRVPLASKPPKPPAQQTNEASLLSQMPYVSTTGNGPNGKTITGFLYKYNQSEVCIVCVCHGSSLTPAGFVEHAGGVDVENPLRHITVVPFAFT